MRRRGSCQQHIMHATSRALAWALVTLICCFKPLSTTAATPPNPSSIGTLVSAYGDTVCANQTIEQPTSTAEVARVVRKYYNISSNGTPVKIRVVTRARGFESTDGYRQLGFHDRAGFTCATSSAAGATTVTLLMQNMRAVLKRNQLLVTVQPGMTVTELERYATSQQLTVPLGAMPGYADLTIGGLLATGGHGFGGKGNSNVADIVKNITFVDGTGRVRRTARASIVGRGLAGGIGMLGVITEITVQLQPGLGKTRSWGTGTLSDATMARDLAALWAKHSNILIYWHPDLGQYSARITEEVAADTPFDPPFISDALTPVGGFFKPTPDASLQQIGQVVQSMHLSDATTSATLCGLFGKTLLDTSQFGWTLGFKSNNGVIQPVISDNATGLTNQMQNCDCDVPGSPQSGSCFFESAPWDRINAKEQAANQALTPSVSFEEAEFTLNRRNLSAFINDVKLITRRLLPGACWPGSFFLLRTGGSTNDHISPQTGSGSDRFLWVEYAQFRPNVPLNPATGPKPRVQKKASAVQEYLEQMMVCKYKARPHWGKGWSRVFSSKDCPIKDLYPASNWATQLTLQQQYDPSKLFETELLSNVLAGGVARSSEALPFCTNELACYCTHDEDCGAPSGAPNGPLCCKTAPAGLAPYKVCLPCS